MEIRINKYLSDAGFCSRRAADKLIEEGRVTINGRVPEVGEKIPEGTVVCVDPKEAHAESEQILIAFNKPVGIVCTATDKQGDNNIVDYINYGKRIYPMGRLDKMSEGLILLTNNGEIMNRMLNASYNHEKEYLVEVDKNITADFVKKLGSGVYLKDLDKTTAPCRVEPVYRNKDITKPTRRFKITLVQGMNRQVRRMCEEFGFRVKKLKRIRIMNILLGTLPTGHYRSLSVKERNQFLRDLKLR